MGEILGIDAESKRGETVIMDPGCEKVLRCDLCGSLKSKVVDIKARIVQCRNCALRFVSHRLGQKDISEAYDWNYENCDGWDRVEPESAFRYETRFNFLKSFVSRGKILDVGAGRGEFLSQAKRTGRWRCFGTETSRYAVDFTKKEFGIELSFGQLEDIGYAAGFFDAVCFWHVLEHLPYPSKAIEKSVRILKDNGFLFIAVPNDSWLGRRHFFKNALKRAINRLPLKRKLKLKKMYPGIEEEGNKHLFYFTPRTLTRLLKKHGFEIKERSVDYEYGRFESRLERRYRFELMFCRFTGVNISNTILIAAQKKKK